MFHLRQDVVVVDSCANNANICLVGDVNAHTAGYSDYIKIYVLSRNVKHC